MKKPKDTLLEKLIEIIKNFTKDSFALSNNPSFNDEINLTLTQKNNKRFTITIKEEK